MTDRSAAQYVADATACSNPGMRDGEHSAGAPVIVAKSHYYLMRGIDVDAGSLTYRTWVVNGSPDTSGAQYTGTKSGGSPLSSIAVVSSWLA